MGGVSGILDLPSVETRTILPDLCVLGPEMPCCLCCGLWKMLLSGVILLSIVPHFAAVCRGGGWWWFMQEVQEMQVQSLGQEDPLE